MDTTVIIVLAIILLALIILNNIKVVNISTDTNTSTTKSASCSQTTFGCCPNGVDSKIDYYGTNCPGYRPGPGYSPTPNPVLPPPNPVLPPPNPVLPPPNPVLPPNPVPGPAPLPKKPIGGCSGTRYGCCPDNIKPKIDVNGSNC